MADSVAGVVLAAGAGRRLAPLTRALPKALCPVDTIPLVDRAISRLTSATGSIAVNIHHGRSLMLDHMDGRNLHIAVEAPVALGTAGALGNLRSWVDGRPVLLTNSDAWLDADLSCLLDGWDWERTRLLVVTDTRRGDFGTARYCGAALLPWAAVEQLEPVPSGLYEVGWRSAWKEGTLELVAHEGPFIDCGTPADYLAANLAASGGGPVIDPEASVEPGAVVTRSVLWPGARVRAGEHLDRAIRTPRLTVLVR